MKKLITAALAAVIILICVTAALAYSTDDREDISGTYAVKLNEIEQLSRSGDTEKAASAAGELRIEISSHRPESYDRRLFIMCGICILFICGATGCFIHTVIMPFRRLSEFAERVAVGDLDVPLEYERTNLFGKFTWAFDSMRNEISKARAREREAIESNKTVIAALSHDIKTPIASIRSYAEALEMGIGTSPEKQQRYISVILNKCNEVTHITDDMFTHSISELDRLRMIPEEFELGSFMEKCIAEISADGDVHFERPAFSIIVNADKGRLAQITENLIANSKKYAKTDISVKLTADDEFAAVIFRDSGKGIPDEDMPFITNKFYRGKNCGSESGAGLGLYIVKYIAEQSGGKLRLKNLPDGFEASVTLPLNKNNNS